MARAGLLVLCLVAMARLVSAQTTYDIYRARAGDTVDSIAERYDIPADELVDLNPFLRTRSPLEHELLTVPVRRQAADAPARTAGGGANGAGGIRGNGPRLLDANGNQVGGRPQREGVTEAGSGAPAVAPAPRAETRQLFADGKTVGRLGITRSDNVAIFRYEGGNTRELYRCPAGTRLVVTEQRGSWFGVLMADRNLGWIDSAQVSLTETNLVPVQSSGSTKGAAAVREAFRYLGVPYKWGGNGFGGIDCSGLVLAAYRSQGLGLPRVSREQATVGQAVPWDQLQPGDRLYFASNGRRIDHTALYVGNGQFIHASGRRGMVCVDNLYNPRYWSIFVGARR